MREDTIHHPLQVPIFIIAVFFAALIFAAWWNDWRWENPSTDHYILIAHHWHATPRTKAGCPMMAALETADVRLREAETAHRDVVSRVLRGRGC